MQKLIIGTVVGAIILFCWQWISWGAVNLHGSQLQYTPNQDEVIECLSQHLKEGQYFVPTIPSGATAEDHSALVDEKLGTPWAQINYHEKLEMNMLSNMLRGFLTNLVVAFLLCWVLMHFADLTMKDAVLGSLAVGVIGYLTGAYLNSTWFGTNSMPDLIDAIVQFGLVGLWLGLWLRRSS